MIKRRLLLAALPFLALGLSAGAWAADGDAEFAAWWRQFQAAVAKRDKAALAGMAQFPLNWELGPIRAVKSKDEFLARFETFFTAEIRREIARGKPEKYAEGSWSITWQARGDEYSLYFKRAGAGGYMLDGLSEGPA